MTRLRSFLWLFALVALVSPSLGAWPAPRPAMEHSATMDCVGHEAPLPDDGPSKDLAKHAAGECCAFMCVGMAVMPAGPVPPVLLLAGFREASPIQDLAGRHLTKDPPPPRT